MCACVCVCVVFDVDVTVYLPIFSVKDQLGVLANAGENERLFGWEVMAKKKKVNLQHT